MPRTFCVTLKETPLRTRKFIESANEIGLNVEIFYGVLGTRLGLVPKFTNELECPGKNIFLSECAIGCNMSHFILWNALKFMPENEFLIFEDDAILDSSFVEKFKNVYEQLPSDWEMAYVGWIPNGNDTNIMTVTNELSIRKPSGQHAYLIKKSVLTKLCDALIPFRSNIDLTIIDNLMPHIKYYVFDPSLVSQHSYLNITEPVWASLVYDWKNDLYGCKAKILNELSLGDGWYRMERDANTTWRWSNAEFTMTIPKLVDAVILNFTVPIEDNLLIIHINDDVLEFPTKIGNNSITIPTRSNSTLKAEIKVPYIPSKMIEDNHDTRTLGICLINMVLQIGENKITILNDNL